MHNQQSPSQPPTAYMWFQTLKHCTVVTTHHQPRMRTRPCMWKPPKPVRPSASPLIALVAFLFANVEVPARLDLIHVLKPVLSPRTFSAYQTLSLPPHQPAFQPTVNRLGERESFRINPSPSTATQLCFCAQIKQAQVSPPLSSIDPLHHPQEKGEPLFCIGWNQREVPISLCQRSVLRLCMGVWDTHSFFRREFWQKRKGKCLKGRTKGDIGLVPCNADSRGWSPILTWFIYVFFPFPLHLV